MATRKAKPAVSTNGTPPDAFTSELSQPVSVATNTAADLSKSLTRGRRKFVGDIAKAVAAEIVAAEKPAVILDDDAFSAELKKHKTEERDERGRVVGWRLSDEGVRLIRERQTAIESNWQPDDITEADQYPEPLRTVVAFRLLCGQYVAIAGISMDSLKDHWKRSKLCDLFTPMADDVAAAMVATNEDPKGLFRALSFCNETDQMRFVDAWRVEILPALKTVEIKLNETLKKPKRPNPHRGTMGELWVAIACEMRSGEPMPGVLAEHWKDTWRHRLWERYGHGLNESELFDKWQGYAAVYFGLSRESFLATQLSDAGRLLTPPPNGATSGDEKPEAVAAPVVVVKADNRKATGKAGGRPRKARRTPEESAVMRKRKANPGIPFWEIDDELGLDSGESAKIHEAVTRRERRNKTESADKTGQN